ncbi:cell division topological specificity factor MinE [bacterium]|nr:cell division topological specificity factor MinE [bacterium]
MSDNIFAEIYNRILSLFGQNVKDESKNTAVNRLRLVLMQDRTNLTPEIMNRMRTELIAVLSKYVELDKEALDLNIGQEGEQMALMLSIPVIRAKDEAEIEQALKEEEENKKAEAEKSEVEEETNAETSDDDKEEAQDNSEENQDSENSEVAEEDGKTQEDEDISDNQENANSEEEPTSKPAETEIESEKKPIPKIEKNKKEETSEK